MVLERVAIVMVALRDGYRFVFDWLQAVTEWASGLRAGFGVTV